MKKLLTFMIMLGVFLIPRYTTQAFDIPLNYDVSDNDEAFVQTKNLFDKDSAELGKVIFPSTIGNDALWFTSDFIPVKAGITYAFSSNGTLNINNRTLQYDTNYNLIVNRVISSTITPANDGYIKISNLISDINSYQMEQNTIATSYASYGFLSLNDIFVDGQLITNSDFNDGSTNWNAVSGTGTVTNGIYSFTGSVQYARVTATTPSFTSAKQYFIVARVKATSSLVTLGRSSNSTTGNFAPHSGSGYYEILSGKWTPLTTTDIIAVKDSRSSGWDEINIDYVFAYDLNNLGIDHLTQNELKALYNDYLFNYLYNLAFIDGEESTEAYANGFDAGYETGYNTGYTDAVEEDNAYALGYALGLSEGADMETGSSIIVFVVGAIGFIMMIFGFTTKRRIFNLLSVGAFIVLGGLLAQYVGFIIITIGLVIINVYYTFWGDL